MVRFITDTQKRQQICREILLQLPEWFGIPESTETYIQMSGMLPFWAVYKNNEVVGCLVLKETSSVAAEIYVMGVKKQYQNYGYGKLLWRNAKEFAREKGYKYIHVKTVKEGQYPAYDQTNYFYRAIGFQELECLPELWDSWNPCQIYIQYLGNYETEDTKEKHACSAEESGIHMQE